MNKKKINEQENYEKDLQNLFRNVDKIYKECLSGLEKMYSDNGLSFDGLLTNLKGLSGDVHAKVLGNYLAKKCNVVPKYEVKVKRKIPSWDKTKSIRIDILINDIAIEVKKTGLIGKLEEQNKRWEIRKKIAPLYKHYLVSFNRSEKRHNFFKNRFGAEAMTFSFDYGKKVGWEYFPSELERLVKFIK